jgi:hypothetical protein
MAEEIDLVSGNFQGLVEKAFQSSLLSEANAIVEGIVHLMLEQGTDIAFLRIFGPKGASFHCPFEIEEEFGKSRKIPHEPFDKRESISGWDHIEELKERIETDHGVRSVEPELEARRSWFNKTASQTIYVDSLLPDALENLRGFLGLGVLNSFLQVEIKGHLVRILPPPRCG